MNHMEEIEAEMRKNIPCYSRLCSPHSPGFRCRGINECMRKLTLSLEALESANRIDEEDVKLKIQYLEEIRTGKRQP